MMTEPNEQPAGNPESDIATADAHARPWEVVVLNDDHNTFDHVIAVLMRVVGLGRTEAMALTLYIHHNGSAVVAGPMSAYEAKEMAKAIQNEGIGALARPVQNSP
jgi:ATP-dependent Clp protease adapter protein ClpS